jgi:hypothetical protein
MQMIFIGGALLVLALLAFFAIVKLGNWALRKWDAHTVLSHSRNVEREAKRREQEREERMRRYVMDDLRPARKS